MSLHKDVGFRVKDVLLLVQTVAQSNLLQPQLLAMPKYPVAMAMALLQSLHQQLSLYKPLLKAPPKVKQLAEQSQAVAQSVLQLAKLLSLPQMVTAMATTVMVTATAVTNYETLPTIVVLYSMS